MPYTVNLNPSFRFVLDLDPTSLKQFFSLQFLVFDYSNDMRGVFFNGVSRVYDLTCSYPVAEEESCCLVHHYGQAQYHQEHMSRHLDILIFDCGGSDAKTERRRVVFPLYSRGKCFTQVTKTS